MSNQDNLSLDELVQQKKALEIQIKRKISADRKKKIAEITAIMQAFDITLADLEKTPRKTRKDSGRTYKNPETGATWGGMGKRPKWISDAVAKGVDINTFLVS